MKRLVSSLLCLSILCVSACGSGNAPNDDVEGDPTPTRMPTPAESAATLSAVECYLLTCNNGLSRDVCGRLDASFDLVASVQAGRMDHDPAEGDACKTFADQLLATTCLGEDSSFETSGLSEPAVEGPCARMFAGKVATGTSCYDTKECSDGYCDFSAGACPGTCTARKGANGACSDDEACQVGFWCANRKSTALPVLSLIRNRGDLNRPRSA